MTRIAFIAPARLEEENHLLRHFACRSFSGVPEALQWKPDALFFATPDRRRMKESRGVPVLCRPPLRRDGKASLFRYLALRGCYRQAAVILAGGSDDDRHFHAHGVPRKKTVFIPRALDNACYADSAEHCYEEQARRWRLELHIPEGRKVLLCLDTTPRDADILLESFHRFRESDTGQEWYLLLSGQRKGGGGVRYLAPEERPAPPVYYRLGDLAVSTATKHWSYHSGVNAAMASSRPVLLTETIGNAIDLLEPGRNGWCVDSAHPELWFDFLKPVCRERLRKMGNAARKTIELYDAGEYAQQLTELLHRLP